MLTKKALRDKILYILENQKEEERTKKSQEAGAKLFDLEEFKKAKTVMFYLSYKGEVRTEEMIEKTLAMSKTVVVPTCDLEHRELLACKIGPKEKLVPGTYGVPEPSVKRPVSLEDIDLVVVPGVAFDKQGNRLGRGKGYYDRCLNRLPSKAYTVGLAFDFQILPSVPTTASDYAVDEVIFA